jgi:hypothetical protein
VDEQQPSPDDPFDDDVYAPAWWQWFRHHLRPESEGQEAARALEWARDGVDDVVLLDDPESAVTLVHRLLHEPGANPEPVAEMPLTDLLEWRGPEVEQDVAGMCAKDPVWREAVGMVDLDDEHRAAVPALAQYLAEPYRPSA